MKQKEIDLLRDLQAFIDFGIKHNKSLGWILDAIAHDCTGILLEESCFSPRTSGYADVMKQATS